MAEAIATLSHWWQIILAGVGIVASYVRLQGQVTATKESVEKLEARLTKQRDEDVARTARSLESIDKKLDRLVDHILTK